MRRPRARAERPAAGVGVLEYLPPRTGDSTPDAKRLGSDPPETSGTAQTGIGLLVSAARPAGPSPRPDAGGSYRSPKVLSARWARTSTGRGLIFGAARQGSTSRRRRAPYPGGRGERVRKRRKRSKSSRVVIGISASLKVEVIPRQDRGRTANTGGTAAWALTEIVQSRLRDSSHPRQRLSPRHPESRTRSSNRFEPCCTASDY